MKIKLNRASVFLQLVAHRERERVRPGLIGFSVRDLRAALLVRKMSERVISEFPMARCEHSAATQL